MATLTKKQLIHKEKSPAQYSLTEEGANLAKRLYESREQAKVAPLKQLKTVAKQEEEVEEDVQEGSESVSSSLEVSDKEEPLSQKKRKPSMVDVDLCCVDSEMAEVVLLLDYREIKKTSHKNLYKAFKQSGIKCEKRNLDLGDIMWIHRSMNGSTTTEIVIDFIVERKKVDDLAASLEDGRYKEQKFRLRRSGLKNLVYLVEGSFDAHQMVDKFEMELALTQIEDSFFIQRTQNEDDTAAYLIHVTRHFHDLVKANNIVPFTTGITYEEFSGSASKSKNLRVSDLFAKQLIQFPSCTAEKAADIVQQYPTPKSLLNKLHSVALEEDREALLKDIQVGTTTKKRKIGLSLSKTITAYYETSQIT